MDICIIERERTEIQSILDGQKNCDERNFMGQYATPNSLANDIVLFTLKYRNSYCNSDCSIRFLEPAFGTGSFYSALLQNSSNIESAIGVEIDEGIYAEAKRIWNGFELELINEDFSYLEPKGKLINLLITNPPYVRHHHIKQGHKKFLKEIVENELGYVTSGYSGLYCYFILLAHKWLQQNALCTWLIPSEFMDVNYGVTIKKYLTNDVSLRFIHKYDIETSKFSDALVSSSVVIYQNTLPKINDEIIFTYGGTINNPDKTEKVSLKELKTINKWGNLFTSAGTKRKQTFFEIDKPGKDYVLGDFFEIKRGIATGNNNFFIIPEDEIKRNNYPACCFRPILPSPRNLKEDIIESDINGVPLIDQRLFVIDTDLPEEIIKDEYKSFWEYLKKGIEDGIKDSYLVRCRKIWYSQEKRDPAPFLCTYMGRGNNERNPFKFIWNKSYAIASNSFLLLYPKEKMKSLLDSNANLYLKVYNALKNIGIENFYNEGREYGGGLKKIEPKELSKVDVNNFKSIVPELLIKV